MREWLYSLSTDIDSHLFIALRPLRLCASDIEKTIDDDDDDEIRGVLRHGDNLQLSLS